MRFDKHTHNAFTDTGLDLWLRRKGVNKRLNNPASTERVYQPQGCAGQAPGGTV